MCEYYVSIIGANVRSQLAQTPARRQELQMQDIVRYDPFQHVETMKQEHTAPLWRNVSWHEMWS